MASTLEHGSTHSLGQPVVPEQEKVGAHERKVELHEMPDLTKEAPEVEYGQPKRSWLRYLAIGVTVGAVAVGGGLALSALVGTDTATEVTNEYSLAREHLAQTPSGYPLIGADGTVTFSDSYGLAREHLAQTPGGFPVIGVGGTVGYPADYALAREHVAQTPGGFPAQGIGGPNQGPAEDFPFYVNEGPATEFPIG